VVTAPTTWQRESCPQLWSITFDARCRTPHDGVSTSLLTRDCPEKIGSVREGGRFHSPGRGRLQGRSGLGVAWGGLSLCAALGGNAGKVGTAEMGREHHLGLTWIPVAGLVQIPSSNAAVRIVCRTAVRRDTPP